MTFYPCRIEELVVNDRGAALTFSVDQSGPMNPMAQDAAVVTAAPITVQGVRAPNDRTP